MLLALEFHWHCQWNLINPGKCTTLPKTNKQKINSKIKSPRIVRATVNLLMKQTSTDWRALLSLPPGSRGFRTRTHWWYPPNYSCFLFTAVSRKCSASGECVVLPWTLNSSTGRSLHRKSSEIQRWLSCKKSKRCCYTEVLRLLFI